MKLRLLPCLFTLLNLTLGVYSVILTIDGVYFPAALMVLLAMILDGLDGRLARRFDAASAFGKELDSLADLVSFGVAPGLLVYASQFKDFFETLGLMVTLAYILCGAIRLARFNVLNITTYFLGVPITAAGSFLAFLVLLAIVSPFGISPLFFPLVMILLAYLMVSRIKVPKY